MPQARTPEARTRDGREDHELRLQWAEDLKVGQVEAVNGKEFHELNVGRVGAERGEDLGEQRRPVDGADGEGATSVDVSYVHVFPFAGERRTKVSPLATFSRSQDMEKNGRQTISRLTCSNRLARLVAPLLWQVGSRRKGPAARRRGIPS